jgi:hypothetical protein
MRLPCLCNFIVNSGPTELFVDRAVFFPSNGYDEITIMVAERA